MLRILRSNVLKINGPNRTSYIFERIFLFLFICFRELCKKIMWKKKRSYYIIKIKTEVKYLITMW